MDEALKTLSLAASGMRAQSTRLRIASENLANAQTEGYRRRTVSFAVTMEEGAAWPRVSGVGTDQRPLRQVYEPSHPKANKQGYVISSNVDPMIELADIRQASRSYEAGLASFDQARRIFARTLDILKR
ncbi:MAG TPA: flagellar basal body rod protein FlgC [Alphaproteobacteria bacterium]|nr:flagellar basal body rod protein FlgC [Alphaproteobacteria bacterium]